MPIYELRENAIHPATVTSFEAEGIKERADLQRLLRQRIDSLGEGLMVLAEEFSDWVDSSRRIDLLCLDTNANLVVVELKRNDDGSHMELQALRYAAMVARMTFEQAVDTLARQRNAGNPDHDAAQADILTFLNWDEPDEANFAVDTRVILAAADFGKELTTCVLWLRDRGIDIRCVRLQPYRLNPSQLLVDIQQLIPPPETADFQTQIGVKQAAERRGQAERHVLRVQFLSALQARAGQRCPEHLKRAPSIDGVLEASFIRPGFWMNFRVNRLTCSVELLVKAAAARAQFEALERQRTEAERVFGEQLTWAAPNSSSVGRISWGMSGGYKTAEAEWGELHEKLIDAMVRLDRTFRPLVTAIP